MNLLVPKIKILDDCCELVFNPMHLENSVEFVGLLLGYATINSLSGNLMSK